MTKQKPETKKIPNLEGYTLTDKDYKDSLKTTFAPDKKVEEAFRDYEEL